MSRQKERETAKYKCLFVDVVLTLLLYKSLVFLLITNLHFYWKIFL